MCQNGPWGSSHSGNTILVRFFYKISLVMKWRHCKAVIDRAPKAVITSFFVYLQNNFTHPANNNFDPSD